MSELWIITARDYDYSEVRAILDSEQAAIAQARKLTRKESRRRFPEYEFIIERHRLDDDGNSTGYEVIEYLKPEEQSPPRLSIVASLGCATQAIAPSKSPYSLE